METPTPAKRGRGRPKTDYEIPIYTLPGPSPRQKLEQIYDQWFDCQRCELGPIRCVNGPAEIVFGEGNPSAHVMLVGEAPGEEEESSLIPFTGPSGRLLNKMLAQVSDRGEIRALAELIAKTPNAGNLAKFTTAVDAWRHEEFFLTNAVACRPPDNGTPSPSATKACWERLWNTILTVDPLFIFAIGKTALQTLTRKKFEITKVRGQIYDITHEGQFRPVTYPIMPILHPSFLLRKADWKSSNGDFHKTIEDLKKGLRVVDFLRYQNFGTRVPLR